MSALPRAAPFWLLAWVLCLLFSASGGPSPLYGIHQAQLRFPVATLTAVYAVYALGLLITLPPFGSVSDYLGRRRVILGALTVSACACGVFLAVNGIVPLFAARVLQGVAVSAESGALRAALIELQPGRGGLAPQVTCAVPTLGLGAAALCCQRTCPDRPRSLRLDTEQGANDHRLTARACHGLSWRGPAGG